MAPRSTRRALAWGGLHLLGVGLYYGLLAPDALTAFSPSRPLTVVHQLYRLVGAVAVGALAGFLRTRFGFLSPGVAVAGLFAATAVVSAPHAQIHGATPFDLYLLLWPAVIVVALLVAGGEHLLRALLAPGVPANDAEPDR